MQQDLSSGNSCYFLQMQQQLYKRMCPTKPIPKSEDELAGSGVSMINQVSGAIWRFSKQARSGDADVADSSLCGRCGKRPFSPLIPASWAAVALAYLKEVELLNSKKSEARGKASSPKASGPDLQPPSPTPRRPKFPKKAKGGGEPPPKAA